MGLLYSGDSCRAFLLHSRPAASKKIYLDFDGHITTNGYWNTQNGGLDIVTPMWNYLGVVSVKTSHKSLGCLHSHQRLSARCQSQPQPQPSWMIPLLTPMVVCVQLARLPHSLSHVTLSHAAVVQDAYPYSFTFQECITIAGLWRQVAEDFSMFDVDITTEEPVNAPKADWIRVAIGGTDCA